MDWRKGKPFFLHRGKMFAEKWKQNIKGLCKGSVNKSFSKLEISMLITDWEKLLDSDWLRDCEFIPNLKANSVIRGKLQDQGQNL